ncbi:MAG: hypothetical protein Gaeavirus11_11 [Gaeavirus sp.]|uniref:Uncharacterized protein n=1 Tax=Gaeavirus sp. TaxID=2487767 RepID=A0A3G5A1S0_9VIRU|nr:MAG: hypothetical protein Gaeavirus11_11 [Gaeavirus sp.]
MSNKTIITAIGTGITLVCISFLFHDIRRVTRSIAYDNKTVGYSGTLLKNDYNWGLLTGTFVGWASTRYYYLNK